MTVRSMKRFCIIKNKDFQSTSSSKQILIHKFPERKAYSNELAAHRVSCQKRVKAFFATRAFVKFENLDYSSVAMTTALETAKTQIVCYNL